MGLKSRPTSLPHGTQVLVPPFVEALLAELDLALVDVRGRRFPDLVEVKFLTVPSVKCPTPRRG